jgi:hypothetical protein
MVDRRSEVPTWAYINAQILQEARATGILVPAIARGENSYGLAPGSLNLENSAFRLSLLYCLIVVPKELWLNSATLPASLAMVESQPILGLFSVEVKPPEFDGNPLQILLRRLRNSISHVRFSIGDDNRLAFWDQRNDNAPVNFRASISLPDLMRFLSTIGPALANLRHVHGGV